MSRARQLTILSISHLFNDLYGSVLPPLYPLLAGLYRLTYASTGLYAAAYLFSSAFLQPAFGYVFDKYRPGFLLPLSLVLGAVGIGAVGFVGGFEATLLCVAVAGTGSAIYHPIASAYSSYSSERRGLLFSIFMIAGRIGAALAPFFALWAVGAWGLQGLAVLALPVVTILYFTFRIGEYEGARPDGAYVERRREDSALNRRVLAFTALVALSGIGSQIAGSGAVSFISLLAVARGLGAEFGGLLLTVHFLGAIVGVPLTSHLSDLKGRYLVSIALLAVASVALMPLPVLEPGLMILASTVLGACLVSFFSLLILIMHEIMPSFKGLATSVIYGVALGGGGLLTPLIGYMIDVTGFTASYTVLSLIGLASVAPLVAVWRFQGKR
ncbi:MAG: MFS transporter [Nitrososphaerota archaeon]|nr:MFS transporter [Candidatus Calditenuaceae archaeon]MDW8073640.1 MFS transporter [Nitrososphaerota archaeon]